MNPSSTDSPVINPSPRPRMLVEGLLEEGATLVLENASQSYAIWPALDLALSVAAGVEWMGRPTIQSTALFVNLTRPNWVVLSHYREWTNARLALPSAFSIFHLHGHPYRLDDLIAGCVEKDAGLIVIDPLYALRGISLEGLAASTGATVVASDGGW